MYEIYLSLREKNKDNPEVFFKEYTDKYKTLVDDSMLEKLITDGMLVNVDQIAYENKATILVTDINLTETDIKDENVLIYKYKGDLLIKSNHKETKKEVTGIIQLKKYGSSYRVDYISKLDTEPIHNALKELN